jgi:protein-S-isoprenylcysteine O-methyltransferase Ste14
MQARASSPSDANHEHARAVRRALRGGAVTTATVALLLLVPAGLAPGGAWLWPQGIAFVVGYAAIFVGGDLVLARWRPAHFWVRQQNVVAPSDRKQPLSDAIGAVALIVFASAWLAFIPLDVFWLHLLPAPPMAARWLGGAAAALGVALPSIAAWENRFATPNVQDQTAEGQHVVDTGVYRLIRHPLYLGTLLLFTGASLWLGSTAASFGVIALLAATLARIRLEERDLRNRLPAYADYARRVPWRLIPWVF